MPKDPITLELINFPLPPFCKPARIFQPRWLWHKDLIAFCKPAKHSKTFSLLQAILEEHKEAEKELIRNRMSRVPHNMPDTLYMVESHKRTYTGPAIFFASSAAGRLERDERRPSVGLGSNRDGNELERYMRCGGMNEGSPGMLAISVILCTNQISFKAWFKLLPTYSSYFSVF